MVDKTGDGPWVTQPFITSPNQIESDPVVVRRDTGMIDIYFNTKHLEDGVFTVETVTISNGAPSGVTSLRLGNFVLSGHAIAAFSWDHLRHDVYVRARRSGMGRTVP